MIAVYPQSADFNREFTLTPLLLIATHAAIITALNYMLWNSKTPLFDRYSGPSLFTLTPLFSFDSCHPID